MFSDTTNGANLTQNPDPAAAGQEQMPMPELSERQERILELVVRRFMQDGTPISSKSLVEQLGVSSATIRNEMGLLEEKGFLNSPHTSAGRVPTEAGYRYFVQRLLGESELSLAERRMIAHQFHQVPMDLDQWMRLAAAVLARTAHGASLVTPPRSPINYFKHLELIATQGRLVLMVLVLQSGDVRQRMLTLAEPVSQEQLSRTAALLTGLSVGLTAGQLRDKVLDLSALDREIMELVIDLMDQADKTQPHIAYRDGLSDILSSFKESQGAEQALRVFEEQIPLEDLLTETVSPAMGSVRVVIAGEGRRDDISLLSIVLGRYGVEGLATGTLGVLGPTHMRYGRAISAVRYVADLMSNLLVGVYGEEPRSPLLP